MQSWVDVRVQRCPATLSKFETNMEGSSSRLPVQLTVAETSVTTAEIQFHLPNPSLVTVL